ncbi:MAG: EpsI family protein [Candidatus Omnitrophica bacterium]|nr:EpsI family protein [Candidatus Omnitrophota bacterium]
MDKTAIKHMALFLVLSVASLLSLGLFFRQVSDRDVLDIGVFPYTVDGWEGKDLTIEEYEYDILETRNIVLREYTDPAGNKLTLFIIYSETNRSVFHPPEVCLIGSGVTISAKVTDTIDIPGSIPFKVNKLYIGDKGQKEIVLYCYKTDRLYTDNYYLQQFMFTMNQFIGGKKGGATIRVSMQVSRTEGETLETLKHFMRETAKIVNAL